MNKVVALLGFIVLITLGGLLFCVGFFTGTTMSPSQQQSNAAEGAAGNDGKMPISDIEDTTEAKSASVSDKILDMITNAASNAADSIAKKSQNMTAAKQIQSSDLPPAEDSQITVDSLLREIAARHSMNDDCSYRNTVSQIKALKRDANRRINALDNKKIVFIGYFKNKVALQIQKLLISRGYKAHVEISKTRDGHESFIFCGPFKKEKHAKILLNWLLRHEFSEARILSVTKEVSGENLYESISEDSNMPINVEKEMKKLEEDEDDIQNDENDNDENENKENKKAKTKKRKNQNAKNGTSKNAQQQQNNTMNQNAQQQMLQQQMMMQRQQRQMNMMNQNAMQMNNAGMNINVPAANFNG